jgi:hypothetical protein
VALIRSFVLTGTGICLALSAMACTALTRPDEITITAEPVAAPTPPAAPPGNPALANPAMRGAAQQTGG